MIVNLYRVLKKDDTTYSDLSYSNELETSEIDAAIVAADDCLLIGKKYPFNNFYCYLGTANENASTMSIQYYDSSQWRNAVDVIDGTSSGGVALARSGGITFSPNKNYGWQQIEDTSETANSPTELQNFTIYDYYWIKITFDNDLSAGTTINRLFYSFTTDQDLGAKDSDLSNYLTALGQTSWEKQIFSATKEMLSDLKARKIVIDSGQLLSIDMVSDAAAYKTLELIYFNLGEDYNNKRDQARLKYDELMTNDMFKVDQDNDGLLDNDELETTGGRFFRV